MPNNKLILRSVVSPWLTPFNDITTGSVLSWADVDNNFIYLKGEHIYSGNVSNYNLLLNKVNSNDISIDLSSLRFTGNTSGNCISDLWVSNMYGCSPITYHNGIKTNTSSINESYSIAFGENVTARAYETTYVQTPITVISGCTFTETDPNTLSPAIILPGDVTDIWNIYIWDYCSEFIISGATGSEIINIGCSVTDIYYDGISSTYIVDPALTGSNYTLISGNTFYNLPVITDKPAYAYGQNTIASGISSHAEGISTSAIGTSSHAEGFLTTAIGSNSHAEGYNSKALGEASHAEGYAGLATGLTSHVEGYLNVATGDYSHAEGSETTASGNGSHSEGVRTIASGAISHAEGIYTTASGAYSHAGGYNSRATGATSFVHSVLSTVAGDRSAVIGGQGITGSADDTVYVPNLNINSVPANDDALTDLLVRATDGTVKYRLASSLGGSINYSNVIFVDALNGNDSTGVVGRFDKPFATIFASSNQAASISKTDTQKALIYIRRGSYYFDGNLQNYLDYYCEPGVVFTGGLISPGAFGDVISNLFGYAILKNTGIDVRTASNCIFEFDYMSNSASAIYVAPVTGTATINVKANYIYSSTSGTGFGISLRNSTNAVFNVSRGIESVHSTFAFRFFTGTVEINSNIYLGSGNLYGGNYKQALIYYDASTSGSTTVNGNIINKDTVNYGGIGSLVTIYSGANPKLKINGNIVGGPIKALDGNTQTNGTIEINGDLSSDNLYTVWAYGGGELLFKNSVIKNSGVDVASILGAINGTGNIFFKDCYFYNGRTDSSLLVINSTTCQLVLDGCSGESEGTLGNSVYSSVGAVNVRVNNSRFNKDKSVDITDLYSPSGFIYDTNTIVPTKIN